jgi:hypothetical protein
MANVFGNGNWILDTPSTTALLLGCTNTIRVKRIEFLPNANGDQMVLKDGQGDTKVDKTALAPSPAGDEILDFGDRPLRFYGGFVFHTLNPSGGTVNVYLAD